GWPRISESFGPTIRATRSLPPPAANPTMMRMGLPKWRAASSWADASPDSRAARSMAANARHGSDTYNMRGRRTRMEWLRYLFPGTTGPVIAEKGSSIVAPTVFPSRHFFGAYPLSLGWCRRIFDKFRLRYAPNSDFFTSRPNDVAGNYYL